MRLYHFQMLREPHLLINNDNAHALKIKEIPDFLV